MLKRITSIILSIVLTASVCPVYSAAEETESSSMDGSLNMFDIERTNYGVLDKDVVATKFTEGDNYEIVYPKNPMFGQGYETYATPCVIIREAYDGELYKYYLISTKKIVKTYIADTEPELLRISDDDASYSIYRVYNSETKLYDVYNATTDTYYEYGFDSVTGIPYSGLEYWKDCYEVIKDEKYGILGKKGEVLYEPYYYDVFYYENCATGPVKVEDNYTDYAILANDGSTDGKKLYDSFVSNGDNEIYCSKIGDYGPFALVDTNTLEVYTDYIYKKIEIREVDGKKYLLCNVQYENENGEYHNYQEIISSDGVWNSLTETGGYSTSIEWAEGYDSFKLCSYGDKIRHNRVYTVEGTCLYSNTAVYENYYKDPDFDDTVGYINGVRVQFDNETRYSIYDRNNQLLADMLFEPTIVGDYIYAKGKDTNTYLIYNQSKGELVADNCNRVVNRDDALLIEDSEGKHGIIDIENGNFSGFIFTAEQLNDLSTSVSNGYRKLWYYSNTAGESGYINDEFKVISNKCLAESGDYLLEYESGSSNIGTGKPVRIIDYDGNVIIEFTYGKNGTSEGWSSIDTETQKQGLISADGKVVLDNLYAYVGRTVNGLTLVGDTNDDYFSIIDNNGNALIFGEFYRPVAFSNPYYYCDYSGFVALPREENYKDVVYIYDFSKCLGTASEVELPTEDILYGEYNRYLNNEFYNSMADNVTTAIADAVAANSANSARVTAWAKSMLSGGLEYSVKQLLSFIPTSELSEDKVSQELAMEYLKSLEHSQMQTLIKDATESYDFAKKIDGYYEQVKNLDSEINKLKFSNLWVSDQFSQEDVYKLVNEAEKKTDLLKTVGKGMTVAEYVMSYMMLRTIENGVVERLKELVPENSSLYKGLDYISKQQKDANVSMFIAEYLTDKVIGKIADFAQESLIAAFTSTNTSLVAFIINTSLKLLATQIDSPTLEEIDKAVIALANIQTLKQSIEDYQSLIDYAYNRGTHMTLEQMKDDYSILVKAYFRSLMVGLDCAKAIAGEENADKYDALKSRYELKLLYHSYINTCLVNATAMWEYTVEANKAVLSKLKAQFPKGEGRLPLYDLVFSDKYNDDIYENVGPSYQYAIDIPSEVDGYEVGSVSSGLVSDESKLNGVYIPDGVENIDGGTFENCTGLDTVYAGQTSNIPDNAFSEDVVSTRDKEIAEIKIVTAANVTEMNMQDDIDDTGLSLEVTYTDGIIETVNEGFVCYIDERVNGQNTVVVNYNGSTTEYPVTIKESDCEYTVKYVDEFGNVLKEEVTGTAKSGSTLTVNADSIEGYTAVESEISEVIGFENEFVITYEKNKASNISEAVVEVEDAEFTGSALTPEIKVTVDGKTLVEGTDYTVVYENNVMSGTAYAIIYGCGEYAGMSYGEFEITGGTAYGDVDADGKIVATDALLVLQSAARIKELTELQKVVGDVDGDGKLNASDALWILKYAARLTDSFPVQQ